MASKDAAVKAELEKASLEALKALLDSKGFKADAQKALEGAAVKVAEAHGLSCCSFGGSITG